MDDEKIEKYFFIYFFGSCIFLLLFYLILYRINSVKWNFERTFPNAIFFALIYSAYYSFIKVIKEKRNKK